MFTRKYAPKKLDELIGNEDVKRKVRTWALNWKRGIKGKPLLLYGPPGIGKTSLAYALANEFGFLLIELSASDFRDKQKIDKALKSSSMSLFGKPKLILLDDIDAMTSKDRGGISELSKLLKEPKLPIILTANDAWNQKLAPIRNECQIMQMKRPSPHQIFELLKKIKEREHIAIEDSKLMEIAKNSKGDVRSALNDLESLTIGRRDRKEEIFQVLKIIFKTEKLSAARYAAMLSDLDPDMLKAWIRENIPVEYAKPHEIALAYDYISRADVFDGRISSRQYWGFMRYSMLLATAGVALAKDDVYRKFTKYQFPSYIRQLSQTKTARALMQSIGKKIGKKIHTSSKKVVEFFGLYVNLIKEDLERAKVFYRLSDEELGFIKRFNA